MSNITIQCPATGAQLDTGVATTAASLAAHWNKLASAQCPHCHAEHVAVVRELFAASVISNERLRGTDFATR